MVTEDYNAIATVISHRIARYPIQSPEAVAIAGVAHELAVNLERRNPTKFKINLFIFKCKLTGGE